MFKSSISTNLFQDLICPEIISETLFTHNIISAIISFFQKIKLNIVFTVISLVL